MARFQKAIAVFVSALLAAPHAVSAATVAIDTGTVLVRKGEGFVPLAGSAEVAPGSQIMVQPGGAATITYASNCSVRIGSGVWLVKPGVPCTEGSTSIDFTKRMNQAAPGEDNNGVGFGILAIGGGVLVSCLVWWCQQGSKTSP